MADVSAVAAGKADVEQFQGRIGRLREEIGKVIVGNRDVIDGALTCMLAGSHALLEGVPGLGKTVLVKTMAEALALKFSRVQFTPDLMPADIIGTTVIDEDAKGGKVFEFRRGPIFANIVLADEINRATPKTQSALLEAMQEHRVTVAKTTYRIFFKLHVPFPSRDELHTILERTTGGHDPTVNPVLSRDEVISMQKLVREVPVARHVQDFVVRVLEATHPDSKESPDLTKRFVRFGASPRGAQSVLLAAKIRALFEGRFAASIDDVRKVCFPALRHRVLLNFEGEAEGVKTDQVIEEILAKTPEAKT
jgi:MoxR-like ATPase